MTSNSNSNKKEANAFQVMMDARYKSIGTNSIGTIDRVEVNVLKDQNKELLAKRKIKFEAWAAEKGALKRKIKEEAIDMHIQEELDKRAKRLRKLIANQNKMLDVKSSKPKTNKSTKSNKKGNKNTEESIDLTVIDEPLNCPKPLTKVIDTEFLTKLSPSLKKNQNLLSYFEKTPSERLLASPGSEKKALLKSPKWKVRIVSSNNHESITIDDIDTPKTNAPITNKITKQYKKPVNINHNKYLFFPKISHVNQNAWSLPKNTNIGSFKICCDVQNATSTIQYSTLFLGSFTNCNRLHDKSDKVETIYPHDLTQTNIATKNMLTKLLKEYSTYPIMKTYESLESKLHSQNNSTNNKKKKIKNSKAKSTDDDYECGKPWCDLLFPKSSEEFTNIDGNWTILKDWLDHWKTYNSVKSAKTCISDESCSSDSDFLNADSAPEFKSLKNTAILLGPSGSGKTSTVYLLANELGYNVIELNASSKRTGKIAFSKLQEATQSHGVQSKENNSAIVNESANKKKKMKNKKEKGVDEEKNISKKLSLILIEDIDIVFDEDDGLISTLSQMVQTSKRPIIFTCCDENNANVQRFLNDNLVIKFSAINCTNMLIWLQVLCLVNKVCVDKCTIKRLLDLCKGDIRKTIHQLQYWILGGADKKIFSTLLDSNIGNKDDVENSNDQEHIDGICQSRNLLCSCVNNAFNIDCHLYTTEHLWYNMSLNSILNKFNSYKENIEVPIEKYEGLVKILDTTLYVDTYIKMIPIIQSKGREVYFSHHFKNYLLNNVYMETEVDPHICSSSEQHYKR